MRLKCSSSIISDRLFIRDVRCRQPKSYLDNGCVIVVFPLLLTTDCCYKQQNRQYSNANMLMVSCHLRLAACFYLRRVGRGRIQCFIAVPFMFAKQTGIRLESGSRLGRDDMYVCFCPVLLFLFFLSFSDYCHG